MKVIIAGSRAGIEDHEVYTLLDDASKVVDITEVVSGCARGVDEHGQEWAFQKGIPVKRFPANWLEHGRAAGPIRNGEMAAYADALIAIWDGQSRGTKDMIQKAKGRGLKIISYTLKEDSE